VCTYWSVKCKFKFKYLISVNSVQWIHHEECVNLQVDIKCIACFVAIVDVAVILCRIRWFKVFYF